MRAVEDYARRERCLGIYLDTFEYQALPFYEKLGYEQFGVLEGYPPGYRQFHLRKRLVTDSGNAPSAGATNPEAADSRTAESRE